MNGRTCHKILYHKARECLLNRDGAGRFFFIILLLMLLSFGVTRVQQKPASIRK